MLGKSTKAIVAALIAVSAAIYVLQFIIFNDFRDTAFYMLQDLAFLPVQIALVTLIVGKIINEHEKKARIDKTRILTSTFFSDIGTYLLEELILHITNIDEIAPYLQTDESWTARDFENAAEAVKSTVLKLDCDISDFEKIHKLLIDKRMTLLVIASNPTLLEHEAFTDMLWTVFHLNDELTFRTDKRGLAESDLAHLNSDAEAVLKQTLINRMCHLQFLQKEYPNLYLLEAHRNSFK